MLAQPSPRDFLLRALAWPADEDVPGYVNVHWLIPTQHGKTIWVGKPSRDVDQFLSTVMWASSLNGSTDVYMCMSRQAKTRVSKNGKVMAARHQRDALALKSIYLDVDVKAPPKGYATRAEAIAAIMKFVKDAGLPAPSALINSGGGIHVYWISDRALTLDQWQPYADGLKALAMQHGLRCDYGVTSDSARVLRPPGTRNFKTNPPKPVTIMGMRDTDYDFAQALAMLPGNAPVSRTAASRFFDAALFPKRIGGKVESLAAGIDQRGPMPPLDPKPLFAKGGCGFLRDALATGGQMFSQPEWNLTTLLATWMEKGNAFAHAMAKGHAGYDYDGTEALWSRKLDERHANDIGWPSCNAIHSAGSKACVGCPHFGKGKSPLNLSTPAAQAPPPGILAGPLAASVTAAVTSPVSSSVLLPDGYVIDAEGYICKVIAVQGQRGQPPDYEQVRLFSCYLTSPWAQREPDALNFTASLDRDHTGGYRTGTVSIEMVNFHGKDLFTRLLQCGVKYVVGSKILLEEFIMAWLTKLHNAQEAASAVSFGWFERDGKKRGFSYGGTIFMDDGSEQPAGMGDPRVRQMYQPKGQLQPWFDALQVITSQNRPELEIVVATAFAGPMMAFTGQYSCMLSAWGNDTGAGKSTAQKVGAAVWGHPKLSRESTNTTYKSLTAKMGAIRNLTVYWDELSERPALENMRKTLFTGTQGVGHGALKTDGTQRDKSEWQTIFVCSANESLANYVADKQHTTAAGAVRIFEYEILKVESALKSYEVDAIMAEIESNYGSMGLRFARYIGQHPDKCHSITQLMIKTISDKLELGQDERFWGTFAGCILAGAAIANQVGCNFHLDAIRDFMCGIIERMRVKIISSNIKGGSIDNTEDALTSYIADFTPNQLWTRSSAISKPGKPPPIEVVMAPNPPHSRTIYVHWAIEDRMLRFPTAHFKEWLAKKEVNANTIIEGLEKHFGAKISKVTLCAGTSYNRRAWAISIPIPAGSDLENMMNAHTRPEDLGDSFIKPGATP